MSGQQAMAMRAQARQQGAPAVIRRSAEAPSRHTLPPITSLSAVPAVQRKCAACEKEKRSHPIQPRLEVGPAGDRFEREADSIAARVMAMPDPGAAQANASSAQGSVQRACSCGSSGDTVRAQRGGGPETLAASDGELTRGGAALPAATRSFFEGRMGRDLSGVRVHQGSNASAKNASISARAFTYKNHVWLGASETAGPSFTMAHELAHVMQQTAPGPVGPQRRMAAGARAQAGAPTIRRNLLPPGNCTQSQYIPLRAQVVFWCKEPAGLSQCQASDSCGQLRLKIRQFQMCARVRQELGDICFGGGDRGHRQQVLSVRRGQANCMAIYRSKCERRRRERVRVPVPVTPPVTVPEGRRERSPLRVPVTPPVVAPPVTAPPVTAPPVTVPPVTAPPVTAPPVVTPVPAPPVSTWDLVAEWARQVVASGENPLRAAERLIAEHPNIAGTVAGVGVVAIIALLADDLSGAGIADDVLVPIIAALEWVAARALIFGPPVLAAARAQ